MPPAADSRPDPVPPSGVAVVIPARNEAERIAATVTAARSIPGVRQVVVVDDGSSDDTARQARDAGAEVVRHLRNRGKAAALETGAAAVTDTGLALLFVDADLGASAVNTAALTGPVLSAEADMTIAVLPPQATAGGGRGLVVRLARRGVLEATGWVAGQPLSGMRCLTRAAFDAARPLAPGWGVETALTIDLLTAGYTVVEVPCDLHHRVTGSDWRGQLHRAGQYRDVARALAVRRLRRATPLGVLRGLPRRWVRPRRGPR